MLAQPTTPTYAAVDLLPGMTLAALRSAGSIATVTLVPGSGTIEGPALMVDIVFVSGTRLRTRADNGFQIVTEEPTP